MWIQACSARAILIIVLIGPTMGYAAPGTRRPVLVELFASEGCSSCPPADALLNEISREQPYSGVEVVVVSFPVTYWNQLGWVDPFAKEWATERQQRYAAVSGKGEIYTPQAWVAGRAGFVPERARLRVALSKAAAQMMGHLQLTVKAADASSRAQGQVRVAGVPADGESEIWVAMTESGLTSDPSTGENRGKHLVHAPIVRSLKRLGLVRDGTSADALSFTIELDPSWNREHLTCVAFVQKSGMGPVLAVAQQHLRA